ncbi:hypothetical protein MRB53_023849 [Persea americana]|uniref:Uncharacterized protein n=1 Tax=Persea americana TaxID=3435 RepID=A0ACC2LAT0_PERAE|nr:hypothetical protein MRB53_023849 [Persea americana]
MRAEGFTLQQALTVEAASIVKQAVSLARRRGHAQVTPLHVANTMLTSSTGLLRTACLQSHSHPLQCKALELCFNVALNRLPASTSSPMMSHHMHHPSLSNALVAAFKRAQAHQRRGSIENQQQALLVVKVELEQLIISILDDPSVSRVMREAGFSSTQVKSNVEQTVSLEICEASPPVLTESNEGGQLLVLGRAVSLSPSPTVRDGKAREEDVKCLMESLVDRRKRSTVIVGECLATAEEIARGVMDKVDKGEVPEALRDVQFISFHLFSYGHLSREAVEQKIRGIRNLVKSSLGRGVLLYLGDLKWVAEYMASEQRRNYNCPVEHMVMELGRLVCGVGESRMIRLLGIASYQTYMKCRIGLPSLETILGLHPITVPAGSLGLSLSPDSDSQGQMRNISAGDGLGWSLLQEGSEKPLTCFSNVSFLESNKVHSLQSSATCHSPNTGSSTLPSWLQQYKEENKSLTSNDQNCLQVRDLCKNWNSTGNSVHKQHHHPHPPERTLSFSSISPTSSISSYEQQRPKLYQAPQMWPLAVDAKNQWKEHHFWISDVADEVLVSNSRVHKDSKPVHLDNLNHNMSPDLTFSKLEMNYVQRFKELNAESLKTLCNSLEDKVPWQQDIIPEIASTILQCRSAMIRRKGKVKPNEAKEDTWLFFQGADAEGKEKIARELASLIFGSPTNFISIGSSTFSSPTRSDCSEDFRPKRSRAESGSSFLEKLAHAISSNPHRIFLVEDIEQVDHYSQLGIKNAIETGRIRNSNGDEVHLGDTIIILSCEGSDLRSRVSSPVKQRPDTEDEEAGAVECEKEARSSVSLDLNLSLEDRKETFFDDFGLLESVDGLFVFKL